MSWRQRGRSVSLLFFTAVAVYLACVLISASLTPRVALWMRGSNSLLLRVLTGALATDVSKLIALLPAAACLARALHWPATALAGALVTAVYTLDILLSVMLAQPWLYRGIALVTTRGVVFAASVWVCALLVTRLRGPVSEDPQQPPEAQG